MAYTKTVWANGVAPAIDETNLNKIETELETNSAGLILAYRNSGTLTVPTSSATVVPMNVSQTIDTAFFSITAGGKVKVLKAGVYIINGIVNVTSAGSGVEIQARINSSTAGFIGLTSEQTTNTQASRVHVTTMHELAANEEIDVSIFHNAGANRTLDDDIYECQLGVALIRQV